MIDRAVAPEVKVVEKLELPEPLISTLGCGAQVVEFNIGSQELVQIDIQFPAGTKFQDKPLVANYTNKLIGDAAKGYSSGTIIEEIDYYGAFLEHGMDRDYAGVSLFALDKHLPQVLPIFLNAILNPEFRKEELILQLRNGKQKMAVELEKVAFRCRQLFNQKLFSDSPYGQVATLDDYDLLSIEDVKTFFEQRYNWSDAKIVISGNYSFDIKKYIEEYQIDKDNKGQRAFNQIRNSQPEKTLEEKESAVQSGLRIGRVLDVKFGSREFFELKVLNTVLGGYFGSRLMANIREDKGYTYGIGSAIAVLDDCIFFFLTTEVGAGEVTTSALEEIYKEIQVLRTDLIPHDELTEVKNYMLGSLLKESDGPFAIADRFKMVNNQGDNLSFYNRYIEAINEVKSSDLLELSKKWLDPSAMLEVVVGKQ